MSTTDAAVGMSGDLDITRNGRTPYPSRFEDLPDNVKAYFASIGEDARQFARQNYATRLFAHLLRPAKRGTYIGGRDFPMDPTHPEFERPHELVEARDLGSGLVTNAGVNMLVNDFSWIGASTPFCTLGSMNYHSIGTGATAAAAADYYLQTAIASGSLTGSTNGYFTGTQSCVAPNIYQTVATASLNATLAVTEWALSMSNAAKFSATATGTPTGTTFPDSGASFTTSGNGLKGWTIEISSTAVNTPTTTVMGLVTSNTSTSLTLANGWWTLANNSGSTPGANQAYVVYPSSFDHKVFSAINGVAGDSVAFTYKLTASSGG